MNMYMYPDKGDSLTLKLIQKEEPFFQYWDLSEKRILKLIRSYFDQNLGAFPNTWLLDAGCGGGRLTLEFANDFTNVLAIDPDKERIDLAKDTIKHIYPEKNIIFEHASIEDFSCLQKFDAILCSHVIQHVHTQAVSLILEKFYRMLKQNGLLIIMTCHSREEKDLYTKNYFEQGEFVEVNINKQEFNALINNEKSILPIHFFNENNLVRRLKNFDFEVLDVQSFHVKGRLYKIDNIVNRDILINSCSYLKRRFGRDMALIAKRD